MRGAPVYIRSPVAEIEDHPRVCGEHVVNSLFGSVALGSSPRMRGAPPIVLARQFLQGIIPAYAGSTFIENPL